MQLKQTQEMFYLSLTVKMSVLIYFFHSLT